jgi:hypothetical protein
MFKNSHHINDQGLKIHSCLLAWSVLVSWPSRQKFTILICFTDFVSDVLSFFLSFFNWCWHIGSTFTSMNAICKVCGLTLLLQVRTMWRCSDSLFFKVPPLASNALLTTLHQLLENMLQTVDHFEISCLKAPFSWLEKPRNCMGWGVNWILCLAWKNQISGIPLEYPPYSPGLAPCNFWAFPTMKRELWGKKFWSDQVCKTFSRNGGNVVRSASLAKEGTWKKETITAPPQSSNSE